RTTLPVRVSSLTSTVERDVLTSTRRPDRLARTTYSLAAPPPASTRTSTKSPFAMHLLFPDPGEITPRSPRVAAARHPNDRAGRTPDPASSGRFPPTSNGLGASTALHLCGNLSEAGADQALPRH